MTKSNLKSPILANAAFWLMAILAHPLAQIVPTGSGEPPKIFSLLIPLFFLLLGGLSTHLLSSALKGCSSEE